MFANPGPSNPIVTDD
jgi:hypothetical protein